MNQSPTQLTHLANGRAEAARRRLAHKAAKEASVTLLEGGAKVYLDSPPGIGYVLELPNHRKFYYASSDQAEQMWFDRWQKDWAQGNLGWTKSERWKQRAAEAEAKAA